VVRPECPGMKAENEMSSTKTNNAQNSNAQNSNAQNGTVQSLHGVKGNARRPYKFLWMVEDRRAADGSEKSFWTKVGVAFENRDGSFSIELAAIPVNGRLQMREPALREAEVA
jgi:hypothetical protein